MRASARASSARSLRIVGLASSAATDSRDAGALTNLARAVAPLRCPTPLLRCFATPAALTPVFFFTDIPKEKACRNSPRQDSPFQPPCHALAEPRADPIIGPMFLDSRKELTA